MATGNGSKAVRKYDVRDNEGHWIGRFIITDDGYFSTVSEWGNYAFWWTGGGPCFRRFLAGLRRDSSYMLSKICGREEYDGDATLLNVKKHIVEERRRGRMTKEEARHEWDLLRSNSWLESETWIGAWYNDSKIEDVGQFIMHRYPAQARHFVEKAYPHFARMLLEELALEAQPHACALCP